MNYIEVIFNISPEIPGKDILVAQLAEIGFESFLDEKKQLKAYIPQPEFNQEQIKQLTILSDNDFNISYTINLIKDENWNQQWERNFSPIEVDDFCTIKAPFHDQTFNTKQIITINPQMSFGTGHHATTYMMIKAMKDINFSNKSVLDMGCGTGVLAILAEKLGATSVWAIDNDEWAYNNTLENITLNNAQNIKVIHGDVDSLPDKPMYDIILANINRNILLQDLPAYLNVLKSKGKILLSGFLTDDKDIITEKAKELNLKPVSHLTKEEWSLLVFEK
jgi:ribosomal protein L11 methyltransferase